jgi:hypothetical protein
MAFKSLLRAAAALAAWTTLAVAATEESDIKAISLRTHSLSPVSPVNRLQCPILCND